MGGGSVNDVPPELNNESNYADWKYDVSVWKMLTKLENKKQGPALYLNLKGKARECVRGISLDVIGAENGFSKLLDALDKLYLKDENTRAFIAFKEFYNYRRSSENITDFLAHFEYLYAKLTQFDMTLPQGVQAFFLLNAINVSADHAKLARATCTELTYENMKSNIVKIFGDFSLGSSSSNSLLDTTAIKTEPTYYAESSQANEVMYMNSRRYGKGNGAKTKQFSTSGSRRQNPKDEFGNVMKCYSCQSTEHLLRYCPDKKNKKRGNKPEEVHITLFNSDKDSKMLQLVEESIGKALLDCGCTKTVAGQIWLDAYLSMLSNDQLKLVKYEEDFTVFRFGNGKESISKKMVHIPATMGKRSVGINVCIVENDLPLLLSKNSMEKAKILLDFNTGRAKIFDDWFKLKCSSSGHFMVPLTALAAYHEDQIVLHLQNLGKLSAEELEKKALKLHRTLGHCSKEKLIKLVKNSKDFNDKRFIQSIKNICDNCKICEKFRKAPLEPCVALPIAANFNDVVCMDLKVVDQKYLVLHLIDAFSRYSVAAIIPSKHADVIVNAIFEKWVAYFGSPFVFLSDNGGEFSNELLHDMSRQINITVKVTPAHSPFSNGTVERHNAVLAETMCKVLSDVNCEPDLALSWALSAKNSLLNNNGFSPNQLVFGKSCSFPSVVSNDLPAFDVATTDVMRKKHKAKK